MAGLQVSTRQLATKVMLLALAIQGFLLTCDLVFNVYDIFDSLPVRRIWNVAREQSVPTWFSVIQMQLLGVTVCLCGLARRHNLRDSVSIFWLFSGLFFIWLGIDDFAVIHERLGGLLDSDKYTTTHPLSDSFSWHMFISPVYACIVGAIALLVAKDFYRHGLLSFWFIGLGFWFISQVLDYAEGLEGIEAAYAAVQNAMNWTDRYSVTHAMKLLEEFFEMLGTTFLLTGFLHLLGRYTDGWTLSLNHSAGDAPKTH